jgi:hypothetical protein
MPYFGTRVEGCRFGQPHDMVRLGENPQEIREKCRICGKVKHWNKTYKGRVANAEYLKTHVRQFCQPHGATKRVFMKIHEPEKTIILL